MDTVKNCKGVETWFLGPTNHRPARVRVKNLDTGESKSFSWEPGLGVYENHEAAAEKVLGHLPDFFMNIGKGGYIFGIDRRKTYAVQ